MISSKEEYLHGMRRYLQGIAELIEDPNVTDIEYNTTSQSVFIDGAGGRRSAGFSYGQKAARNFVNLAAAYYDTVINEASPVLSVRLPDELGRCRLQAYVPPVSRGVRFTLRKPGKVFPLSDYVDGPTGELIRKALLEKKNFLLAGSTGAGKTSCLNAIIAELTELCPDDRLVILEDTPEIQCNQPNHDYLDVVRDSKGNQIISMADNVKNALRDNPKWIILGEVRDDAARSVLTAWRTGHYGFCTFHASGADKGFWQFFSLAKLEYSNRLDQVTTAGAIDYILYLSKENGERRVRQIVSPWYDHSAGEHGEVRFKQIYPSQS